MKVVVSPIARRELSEIWQWNAKERGASHADRYIRFLDASISALSEDSAKGKAVPAHSDTLYILMRRRSRGHGHVAVYRVVEEQVRVNPKLDDSLFTFTPPAGWKQQKG